MRENTTVSSAAEVPQALQRYLDNSPFPAFITNTEGEVLWTNENAPTEPGELVPKNARHEGGSRSFVLDGSNYHAAQLEEDRWVCVESGPNLRFGRQTYDFLDQFLEDWDTPIVIFVQETTEVLFGNQSALRLFSVENFEGVRVNEYMDVCPLDQPEGYQNVGPLGKRTWRRYNSYAASGLIALWFPEGDSKMAYGLDRFLDQVSKRLHDGAGQYLKSAVHDIDMLESYLPEDPDKDVLETVDKLRSHVASAQASVDKEVTKGRISGEETSLTEHIRTVVRTANRTQNLEVSLPTNGTRFDIEEEQRRRFVFRMIREFFMNASHHNPPDTEVEGWIELEQEGSLGTIRMGENGKGFDLSEVQIRGGGLSMMHEFGEAANVDVDYSAEKGEGSWLTLRIGGLNQASEFSELDIPVPAFLWNKGVVAVNNEANRIGLNEDLEDLFPSGEVPSHLIEALENGTDGTAANTRAGALEFNIDSVEDAKRVLLKELSSKTCEVVDGLALPVVTVLPESEVVLEANASARDYFGLEEDRHVLSDILPEVDLKNTDKRVIESDPPISIVTTNRRGIKYQHVVFHVDIVS
jgi:hypothetical protein